MKQANKENFFLFLDEQVEKAKNTQFGLIQIDSFYTFLTKKSPWTKSTDYPTIAYRRWLEPQYVGMIKETQEWIKEYATIHNLKPHFHSAKYAGLGFVDFRSTDLR